MYFEYTVADVENGNVERATAQIEHQDRLVGLLVQTIGERRGGRLVDYSQDVEAGNFTGVLGGLPLRIIKIGGHGDHRVGDLLPHVFGCIVGQTAQDDRRDFLRRILLAVNQEAHGVVGTRNHSVGHVLDLGLHLREAASNEALRRIDGILRIEYRLSLGQLAHQPFARVGKTDHGGSQPASFAVDDHGGLATLHHRDYRIRGS
jgi:hypothetical protein